MAKFDGLEVNEDMEFQARFWRAERVAWIVMLLVIGIALAGLLGPGPLSRQERTDPTSTLLVEYNRFDRYQAPTTLRVRCETSAVEQGELRLSLNSSFVEGVEIQRIDPEPADVENNGSKLTFIFRTPDIQEAATIVFHYEPNKFGKTPGELSVGNGASLHFSQFFYP